MGLLKTVILKMPIKNAWLVFGLVWISSVTNTCRACNPGIQSIGTITPAGDIIHESGTDLILTCTVFTNHTVPFHPGDIQWLIPRPFQPEYNTVVNNRTVQLKIPNVTKNDSGNYSCRLNTPSGREDFCSRVITIEGKPSATGFNCVSLALKYLTCSWDSPPSSLPTNWTLRGEGYRLRRTYLLPTCMPKDNLRCLYNLTKRKGDLTNFTFILDGINGVGNFTQTLQFQHYKRVQPEKPKNFTVESKNSTALTLTWRHDGILENRNLTVLYHLEYRCEWNYNWTVHELVYLSTPGEYSLVNLTPYTDYDIRIQSRVRETDDGDLWSHPSTLREATQSMIPTLAPNSVPGCFKESIVGDNLRNITLYWKPLHKMDHNGPNFWYKVVIWVNGHKANDLTAITTDNSVRIGHLQLNSSYAFVIGAVNANGESSNKTTLLLPEYDKNIPNAEELAVFTDDYSTYQILWRKPLRADLIDGYRIFWCFDSHDSNSCEKTIDWTNEIDGSENETSVTLRRDRRSALRFAIATTSGRLSSGLTWTRCPPQSQNASKFLLNNINIERESIIFELHERCNFGIIDQFVVIIQGADTQTSDCKADSLRQGDKIQKTFATHGSTTSLQMKNLLKSNVRYFFNVTSITRNQQGAHRIMCETAPEDIASLSFGVVIAIAFVCGSVIAFITIVLLKCTKRMKSFYKLHFTFIPNLPGRLKDGGELYLQGQNNILGTNNPHYYSVSPAKFYEGFDPSRRKNDLPPSTPHKIRIRSKCSESSCTESLPSSLATNQTDLSCESPTEDFSLGPIVYEADSCFYGSSEHQLPSDALDEPVQGTQVQVKCSPWDFTVQKGNPGYTTLAMADPESGYNIGLDPLVGQSNLQEIPQQISIVGNFVAVLPDDKLPAPIDKGKDPAVEETAATASPVPEGAPMPPYSVFSYVDHASACHENPTEHSPNVGYVKFDYIQSEVLTTPDADNELHSDLFPG